MILLHLAMFPYDVVSVDIVFFQVILATKLNSHYVYLTRRYATIFIKQGANLQNSASKKRVTMANLHERLHLLNTKERLIKPGKMPTWNNYSLFLIDIITYCFARTMVNCTWNISYLFSASRLHGFILIHIFMRVVHFQSSSMMLQVFFAIHLC